MRIGLLEEQTDLSPADWIVERLRTFGVNVASIIPNGFEAYGRLFHPAHRRDGDATVPVSWSEVASAKGRPVHPEMQWEGISGVPLHTNPPEDASWDVEPDVGSLPREIMESLVDVLRRHTSTPARVWFCTWNGWGGHRVNPDPRAYGLLRSGRASLRRGQEHVQRRNEPLPPTVELPGRSYYLLGGPVEGGLEDMTTPPIWQSANLWWPDDRAWFVSTDIDFAWTYVGGSNQLISQLLPDPVLEVLPAELGHGVSFDSDHLNPRPGRGLDPENGGT